MIIRKRKNSRKDFIVIAIIDMPNCPKTQQTTNNKTRNDQVRNETKPSLTSTASLHPAHFEACPDNHFCCWKGLDWRHKTPIVCNRYRTTVVGVFLYRSKSNNAMDEEEAGNLVDTVVTSNWYVCVNRLNKVAHLFANNAKSFIKDLE